LIAGAGYVRRSRLLAVHGFLLKGSRFRLCLLGDA
jgi:hypothetical protein